METPETSDKVSVMIWYNEEWKRQMNCFDDKWFTWFTIVQITKKEFDNIMGVEYNKLESTLSAYI